MTMAKKTQTAQDGRDAHAREAKRKNIPTAEYQSVIKQDEQKPVRVAYERRNRDLDPQLVWRGRTSRTGATWSSTRRRSTSRRRCTRRY